MFRRFVVYAEIDEHHADDFKAIMALIDDAVVHRNWGTLDVIEASPQDADIAWAMVVDAREHETVRRREYVRQLAALEGARAILHATDPCDGSDPRRALGSPAADGR